MQSFIIVCFKLWAWYNPVYHHRVIHIQRKWKGYIYIVDLVGRVFFPHLSLFPSFHMESVYSPPANVALSTPARRRARTTRRQLEILERFYNGQTAYPDKKQKQQLARLVGFTEESVHFWYVNHALHWKERDQQVLISFPSLSFFSHLFIFPPRFQNHRQTMRTLQGRRQQQQRNEPSSSVENDTSTVTGNTTTTTTTTTLPSSAMDDPVPEQRTQMPPPPPAVSSSSYTNMLQVSSSLSHMQVNSSPRQAFSFSNQPQNSLRVSTHAARLPPFSSFVQDQPHTVASPMPPRAATSSSSYFSAFTPTSTSQQQSPATTINTTTTANAAASGAGRMLSTPGTARLPPIQFYFHHPEFGIESTMLQLSIFGKTDQSSSSG